MESAGSRLKKIRLDKGISLEEAHKATKIDLNILRAIEENELAGLSPIYSKGFIKMYCKYLNVSAQDFIQDYKEPQATVTLAKKTEPKPQKQAVLKNFWDRIGALRYLMNRTTLFIVIIIVASILLLKAIKNIKITKPETGQPEQTVAQAVVSGKKKIAAPVKATASVKPAESVSSSASIPKEALVSSAIRLGINAKDDCWMQLRIDGKTVFQSVLKKGRFEVWNAKEKIELSLGNVGNVEIELNGKVISPLGRRGQSLKNILITKDGLKVPR